MAKPKPINNPEYTDLLIYIAKGEDRNYKKIKEQFHNTTLENLRNRTCYLKKNNFITSNLKRFGRGKGTKATFNINIQGILKYIYQEFWRTNEPLEIAETANQELLSNYLKEMHSGGLEIGIRELLEKFVIGLGRGYSDNSLFLKIDNKRKSKFLERCYFYQLAKKNYYERIAEKVLKPTNEKRFEL